MLVWKLLESLKYWQQYLRTHKAQSDSEEAPKADGYSAVNTQDQEREEGHEAQGNNTNTGGEGRNAEQNKNNSNTKPQALLSVTQLILRRGLVLLVSVLILAIGVAFHLGFPPPEPTAQSKTNLTLNWANDSTSTPLTPLDLISSLWAYVWPLKLAI